MDDKQAGNKTGEAKNERGEINGTTEAEKAVNKILVGDSCKKGTFIPPELAVGNDCDTGKVEEKKDPADSDKSEKKKDAVDSDQAEKADAD